MEKGIFNDFYKYLTGNFEGEHLPERHFESSGLLGKRASAFQVFNRKGFPSIRHEDWKFTNLNRLLKDEFIFPNTAQEFAKLPEQIEDLDACRVVLINGKVAPELSDALPDGITFLNSAAALEYADTMGTIAEDAEDSMLALNTAFFKEFNVLHIAAKKLIEKPIHISHMFTVKGSAAFIPYRMLVICEELSEASVIETFQSDSELPAFISYVQEQQLNEAAVFHSYVVNELGENMHLVQHRETVQYRNSVFNNTNVSLGKAPLVRNDLNFRLKESGTETNLLGTYITTGRQHVDNHTLVDHQSSNCNSSELYKGIIMDRSHGVFNGKIFVRPDAQKTNAFQQNNNVLLSEQAVINSKPQLEIFADDVKCSHGTTVGQLNEDAMFYLNTRGIGKETGKRILVEAFVSDIHSKIKIPALREHVFQLLRQKLLHENLITA